MNRRRLLAAIGGAGLTGGSLFAVTRGVPTATQSSIRVRIETIDTRGSRAGTMQLPKTGTPTVIDLFATWCAPCKKQMRTLSRTHERYGEQVTFVSVTNQRLGGTFTRADLRDWWQTHGGRWTVGVDPASELMSKVGASGLPYLVITDPTGSVVWEHSGLASESTLTREIQEVI